jgi:hypothetical protein
MTGGQTPVKHYSVIYLLVKNSGQFFALHVPCGLPSSTILSLLAVGIRVSYAGTPIQHSFHECVQVPECPQLVRTQVAARSRSRLSPSVARLASGNALSDFLPGPSEVPLRADT